MSAPVRLDPALRAFATTPRQLEVFDAVERLGSGRAAARELGVGSTAVDASIKAIKVKAALSGYSPEHDMKHVVPSPFRVKGTSTYYDKDGKPK